MGFSKKHQTEGGLESDGKKWVIAGIVVRAPLKSITAKPKEGDGDDNDSTTPTSKESRIPEKLPCPPAPRKRRPVSTCHYNGVREFFTPPDLETVFIRHVVERAN
ncbi:cyclin-dependent protein kinase inhibitor SMR6-like [Cornus florida]|uniref:cyclin-dependent protein kinase inhibitor SMR6-like n=1 Tax=Cornus florida TaxID=4283 RepID=UPI00289C8183|nr:cyclin-dependent protein kinase inhibitor SMR6-like [Cornus florida]